MRVLLISFVVALGVGILYGLIRVKSPAPPIVALLGLLGMVIGEQFGIWVQTKSWTFRMPHRFALSVSATTGHIGRKRLPKLDPTLHEVVSWVVISSGHVYK
jgi:XapX domain-containing protein